MLNVAMSEVTQILQQIESGDPAAADQLLPLVYDELRRLAAARMAQEPSDHTLQPTALVHEVYLRLAGESRDEPWLGRRQFFAAAAEAMRRILVENARRKISVKGGGQVQRQTTDLEQIEANRPPDEILALHEALEILAEKDPEKAELVKLRYFVGMTIPQSAEVMGISPSAIDRHWSYARAWLHQELLKGDTSL